VQLQQGLTTGNAYAIVFVSNILELICVPNNTSYLPVVRNNVSKWFCDTSTDVVTVVARCGSFVGGRFGLLVTSYG
jgi:hypothetical protein